MNLPNAVNRPRRLFSILALLTCTTLLLMTFYIGPHYASMGALQTSINRLRSILPNSKDQLSVSGNGKLSISQNIVTAMLTTQLTPEQPTRLIADVKKMLDTTTRIPPTAQKTRIETESTSQSATSNANQEDQFRVLIHPKDCGKRGNGTNTVTFVHTALQNLHDRNEIRETWGSKNFTDSNFSNTVIFVVGNTKKAALNGAIRNESLQFGDLLQSDFEDTYLNLALKHVSWLQWARKSCANVHFFVKVDDDVALNIFLLKKLARSWLRRQINNNTILCKVRRKDYPVRGGGRNSISLEEYPNTTFPPYCHGMAMVFTPDVPRKLFDASIGVKPLSLEDVFVSGILAQRAALAHKGVPDCCIFYAHPEKAKPRRPPLFIMTSHNLNHITAWHRRFVNESKGLEGSWPEINS